MDKATKYKEVSQEASLQRTEEIQYIIERMPTKFGMVISIIVLFMVSLLFLFGWLVRYPDIITGRVSINSDLSPVELVSPVSGRLQFGQLESQDKVNKDQIVGWLETPSNPTDVFVLSAMLDTIRISDTAISNLYNNVPHDLRLGELTGAYFSFINALHQLEDFRENDLLGKQLKTFEKLLTEQENVLNAMYQKAKISTENLGLYSRFYSRDSLLHLDDVLSDADFDRTKINIITAKDQYQSAIQGIANGREAISNTKSKIQEIHIQKEEKNHHLNLELLATYNDLSDQIKAWEQKFVFKAPFEGRIQFLKFWANDQFVQAGEPLFTVIPERKEVQGQVSIPAVGGGKIKVGQEVIIKLDDYPYMEYGTIEGRVESVSLMAHTSQTPQGEMDAYLVKVDFPKQLRTNYGAQLDFRFEIKGTAEIITNDRKLIQRFFDNLKYIVSK